MTMHNSPRIAMLSAVFAAAVVYGCARQDHHSGDDAIFPLHGRHEGVPCESCHGPSTGCAGNPTEKPSTSCAACHITDAPQEPGGHYLGQDCIACHTVDGWNVGVTTTPTKPEPTTHDTDETDTSTTIGPGTTTIPEHVGLDPYRDEKLCWDCHETDRPEDDGTEDSHWLTPTTYKADCAPCHTLTDWNDSTLFVPVHEFRSPHGVMNQSFPAPKDQWIIACRDCHPDSTDYSTFVCYNCHITTGVNQTHIKQTKRCVGVPETATTDENCLCCHSDGMKP